MPTTLLPALPSRFIDLPLDLNIVNPFGFKKHAGGLSEPRNAISGIELRAWLILFEWLLGKL